MQGSGRHLAEARAPGYLETAAGRVALVAATLRYHVAGRAGDQCRDSFGSPSDNAIQSQVRYSVPQPLFDNVADVAARLGLGLPQQSDTDRSSSNLFGTQIERDPDADEPSSQSFGDEHDIEEILAQVTFASKLSDFVVFSLHCHRTAGGQLLAHRAHVEMPSELSREILQRTIDAGAHVAVGHGPQVPLRVELYRAQPIFHGLGAFVFQIETIKYLPQEAYDRYGLPLDATPADFLDARYGGGTKGHLAHPAQWHQMVPICEFDGTRLRSIELHPTDLGFERSRAQRGRPVLAEPQVADEVLARMKVMSAAFGTDIDIQTGEKQLSLGRSADSSEGWSEQVGTCRVAPGCSKRRGLTD